MARERITITIDGKLLKKVKRVAELEEGGNVSAVVEKLVLRGIGDAEVTAQARTDPLTQALVAEMMRPENLERAARIVGETAEDPNLFRQRAQAMVERVQEAAAQSMKVKR